MESGAVIDAVWRRWLAQSPVTWLDDAEGLARARRYDDHLFLTCSKPDEPLLFVPSERFHDALQRVGIEHAWAPTDLGHIEGGPERFEPLIRYVMARVGGTRDTEADEDPRSALQQEWLSPSPSFGILSVGFHVLSSIRVSHCLTALLALSAGCESDRELLVDLRTDLSPGREFVGIETDWAPEPFAADEPADPTQVERSSVAGIDFLMGGRVATFGGSLPESMVVRVRLLRADGSTVAARQLRVQTSTRSAVTVVIARSCANVRCPADGAPELSSCVDGQCVAAECGPDDPDACGTAACFDDGACTESVSCGRASCVELVCLTLPDDARCGGSERCDPGLGCVARDGDAGLDGGEADGGEADAGEDGGLDAGGLDAGGLDAGGLDAGGDAGSPDDVVQLALGIDHTCARYNDGRIYCWGGNANGQLGDGSTGMRTRPVEVAGLGGPAIEVVAGAEFTCALRDDATAWCWGDGASGHLGNASMSDSSSPVQVMDGSGAVPVPLVGLRAIAAGRDHVCAIRAVDGVLLCWGANNQGQLGDGGLTTRLIADTVLDLIDVVAVSASPDHTCALTGGGALSCWGFNLFGQIGDGTTDRAVRATPVLGLSPILAFSAGSFRTCAVSALSELICWGAAPLGDLGPMTSSPRTILASARDPVLGLGSHLCYVDTTGGARCWGLNTSGQLGDSTTASRDSIAAVDTLSAGVRELAVGFDHTCALLAGNNVRCWGENSSGQLGDDSTSDRLTPIPVRGLP